MDWSCRHPPMSIRNITYTVFMFNLRLHPEELTTHQWTYHTTQNGRPLLSLLSARRSRSFSPQAQPPLVSSHPVSVRPATVGCTRSTFRAMFHHIPPNKCFTNRGTNLLFPFVIQIHILMGQLRLSLEMHFI